MHCDSRGLTGSDHVVPFGFRRLAMRVNIRLSSIRTSSRRDHLIVAHDEVVGKGVKGSSVPGRSNHQSLARIRPRERKQPIDRPLRDGSLWKKRDPPLRSGLLSNVPAGLILSPRRARCDLIATFYVESHGRLPNTPYLVGSSNKASTARANAVSGGPFGLTRLAALMAA